ncbi:class F sortase [Phytoactinopolyspora halotolerans]|uniref:Class F sortase n=1 Tax=Phytoactinopolyspora halotolerans TaxID=1981512 RepID=A0A6L9S4A9_9ACTN|nr:class F sortase [Phytoactinopolyspora halotolerans]NED99965.1 class F sortase [Phytoactinopolyspora halotolerans]
MVISVALLIVAGAVWVVNVMFKPDGASGNAGSGMPGDDEPAGPAATSSGRGGDEPARFEVSVPEIGVHAPVVDVGSSDDRVLAPPDDPLVAGWWSEGAAPGAEAGTALLVGHALESGTAVFNGVGGLEEGDTITLSGEAEAVMDYEVVAVDVLPPEELAEQAETLFAQDGPARLVLVTCEGWDGDDYTSNIVVTAIPTEP